jgi:hypothetical protein
LELGKYTKVRDRNWQGWTHQHAESKTNVISQQTDVTPPEPNVSVDAKLDFWSNLQLALEKSLSKETSERVVKETAKEWQNILNSLSLDDIERLAMSFSQKRSLANNNTNCNNNDNKGETRTVLSNWDSKMFEHK